MVGSEIRPDMPVVRRVGSGDLRGDGIASLRALLEAAFEPGAFTQEDWGHALGGQHFLLEEGGIILSHASVVERELHTSGHRLATGYVEGVATRPSHQRRGLGSVVMREVGDYIDRTFQLGALSTGVPAFYERLGWIVWRGSTLVRMDRGAVPTPEEDGGLLVRPTPMSPPLDLWAPISCDWRPGDVW
jgi:aminoglycoside 2'-N-acetyltransferase I